MLTPLLRTSVALAAATLIATAAHGAGVGEIPMTCEDHAIRTIGPYAIENNSWGSAGVRGPHEQCVGIGTLADNGAVSARWTWRWPAGPSEVKAFPQLIYGQKPGHAATPGTNLPIRVDDIRVARSEWATVSRFSGTGQLTFDLWLTRDAERHRCFDCTPISHEIMIALEPYGGYGLSRNPAWYQGEVTIGADRYKLYKADHFGTVGWRFIVLQSLKPRPAGSVDLQAVLALLKRRGLITGAEFLSSVEFGTEAVEGSGSVQVSGFKVDVR